MKTLHLYFSTVLICSCIVLLWTGMLWKSYSRVEAWGRSDPLDLRIPAASAVTDARTPAGNENTEVSLATRGVGITSARGEGLAVTPVARWAWEKYPGFTWRGLQLPVMTAWPVGRLGNLISEYATLYALGEVYGVTVRLHPRMDASLRHIFPLLTMPQIPGNFSAEEWMIVGDKSTNNKADVDTAAAGLLGPHLFLVRGTPHESQLFNAYRRDIQRELTFAPSIATKVIGPWYPSAFTTDSQVRAQVQVVDGYQVKLWIQEVFCTIRGGHNIRRELVLLEEDTTSDTYLNYQAQAFLAAVAKNTSTSTPTFVGFHIRHTDYYFLIKSVWGGHIPSERYYHRAMEHFRHTYHNVTFVVASDEPKHVIETLGGDPDVFLAPGISAEEDLAILAACNHSIMTVGTFGFWGSYLAGGEVVYPNTTYTSRYKMGAEWFRFSKLEFFTPVNDD